MKDGMLILIGVLVAVYLCQNTGAENLLTVTSGCACPGQNITLKCIVTSTSGGSSTVWRGSFFDCPSENNEITFRHSRFVAGAMETCTDGSIVGQSLSSDNGRFTSQLSVRVSPGIVGQYLNCEHDDGSTILPVGSVKMSAAALPPATNISYALTRIEQSVTLTFSWTISVLGCPDVIFNIQASNCGSCPTATRYTNVTCTDIPTDGSMCTFAVETVVCGNTTGNTRIMLPLLDDRGSSNTTGDCSVHIASIIVLGILLIACLTASLTVIAVLIKAKLKIQAELMAANTALNVMNDQIKLSRLDVKQSDIDTSGNVAYSKSSGLLLKKVDVDTKDNVAYSRSDELPVTQQEVKTKDNVAYSRTDEVTLKQREVKTNDNVCYGLHIIG